MPVELRTGARWWTVCVFAMAMAWVESAVVYYLRTMFDRIDPYQTSPLPVVGNLGGVELVREAATLVMLLMVGFLAGRTWRSRLAYAVIAFGVWDIFYYVFLKVMCGWPKSWLDWDILFLIPLPWWGPVWAPMSIAFLMILWGTLATHHGEIAPATTVPWRSWAIGFLGAGVALYTFMADSLHMADQGSEVLRNMLPTRFQWPLFGLALTLLSVPVWQQYKDLRVSRSKPEVPVLVSEA